ncbi:MAG TPA: hypothetical protein VFE48_23295 [Methylomirabilota bacterium]|nr:hypothetical protein [Methylomirabilota bacterium]
MQVRVAVLSFALLLLAGCGTISSRPDPLTQWQAEQEQVGLYCRELFRDRALDPLRTKMAIDTPKETTFEMLTDQSKPTQSERSAIVAFAKDKQECNRAWSSAARPFPIPPQAIVLRETNAARFQFLLAELHGGGITYGEFARKRQELAADLDAKLEELAQLLAQRSVEAGYRAQQLANEARKAAALEEQVANQRRLQQQLQESTGPRLRQPLNCTTNYFGSSAQTTCN